MARDGKAMMRANPNISNKTKGREPPTISFMLMSGTAAFSTNRLRPTGGVIIPISTFMVTMTPNQIGSKPSWVTIGKIIGSDIIIF